MYCLCGYGDSDSVWTTKTKLLLNEAIVIQCVLSKQSLAIHYEHTFTASNTRTITFSASAYKFHTVPITETFIKSICLTLSVYLSRLITFQTYLCTVEMLMWKCNNVYERCSVLTIKDENLNNCKNIASKHKYPLRYLSTYLSLCLSVYLSSCQSSWLAGYLFI